jgi:V/A-type H+-transporting ATPase subunit E
MSKSIESFVEKLKTEGVDAGQQAAEKIKTEAQDEAKRLVAEAETVGAQRVAAAEAEAEQIRTRMQSSLELATRDALLLLQEKLNALLNALLAQEVQAQLTDEDTLATVLREVIPVSARAASERMAHAEIHIPKDMQSRLLTGALRELTRSLKSQNVQAEVKASLVKAGFEYKIEGSTIEVTTESVTALLSDLIDPELREVLYRATVDQTVAG